MALNTLPAGAFADDAITSDKINLANTFAFTGTVTGTPSDWVKLNETVASGATNVIFNNTLVTTTYQNYVILGSNIAMGTNATNFETYLSADNGSSYTGDTKRGFVYRNLYSGSSFGHAQQTNSNTGGFFLCPSLSSSTGLGGSCQIYYQGITTAGNWRYINYSVSARHSGGEAYEWNGASEVQQSSVVNTIKLQASSGTLYGTYTLYGVK